VKYCTGFSAGGSTKLNSLFNWLSFKFDDRPMANSVYESHVHWIKFFHDYYFRVEHFGFLNESLDTARREHCIVISNHALTFEAVLINYLLLIHRAGHVGTLVYPEAFKLPFIREFLRSCQCAPISVAKGVKTLKRRHILLFPEGMDFVKGLLDPDRTADFHTGFLRMAKEYMDESGRSSVNILPVAHNGIEQSFKFWLIRNEKFLNWLVRPWARYPFWVIPKLPLILPSKVIFNWGTPMRVTKKDVSSDKKIQGLAKDFRREILDLRKEAKEYRGKTGLKLHFSMGRP